jgi:hypothetical protein
LGKNWAMARPAQRDLILIPVKFGPKTSHFGLIQCTGPPRFLGLDLPLPAHMPPVTHVGLPVENKATGSTNDGVAPKP